VNRRADDTATSGIGGVSQGTRRLLSRRLVWHTAGLLVALVLAWLILQAYRQPELIIDLTNLRFC
jgi:hypothetical protein